MDFIKNNKKALISVFALAFFVLIGEITIASVPKTVYININDIEDKEVETSSDTVEDLLLELGYNLDQIKTENNLEDAIRNNYQLKINTRKTVQFSNEGNKLMVNTYSNNVEEFLNELNINHDEYDIITPALDAALVDGTDITYDDVVIENYQEFEDIKFETKNEYTFDLEFGKSEVKVKGVNGQKTIDKTKTTINDKVVSDVVTKETTTKEPTTEIKLIGTKEVVESAIEPEVIERANSSLYKGETNVIQEGKNGLKRQVYENNGTDRKLVEEKVITESVERIVEYGTKSYSQSSSSSIYTLQDLQFHGVINWGGYKFTYYSQSVLPGAGLNIPGRHVNAGGFVADGDGYIVIANSAPKGTIINTPFGYQGKVYDRGTYGNHMDVYTR